MCDAGGEGGEVAVWHILLAFVVASPTDENAVGAEPTGVIRPRGYGSELAGWDVCLAVVVGSPACDGAVCAEATRVA